MLITFCLQAQENGHEQKAVLIYKDTINLRGYIYDNAGKPIRYFVINSTQLDLQYNSFKIRTYTDTTGYFELKGAKFNDTLTTNYQARYDAMSFYNKDSMYMIIYMPPAKEVDINAQQPLMITEKRKFFKSRSVFKVKPYDGPTGDFTDVHILARFKGGNQKLLELIKNYLKYPEIAVEYGVEGTVQIAFLIEKDGSLTNFKTIRGLGYGCEEAVINALKKYPGWIPTIDDGRPYVSQATISVKFSLTDK
ncbi:energy transducer TonB [Mucilaginibacter lappiensis]|uniref:TonB family protein n=1 Tax=Mucilaginibacter lappiensis TaxID=354630 RepID=A0A841JFI6_9SPHI|nr:energy transducer TonB [Mucilaginibacter lappiensis]MBB6129687.1 TonB family protein [Mucilaginibacter lappiensis]